ILFAFVVRILDSAWRCDRRGHVAATQRCWRRGSRHRRDFPASSYRDSVVHGIGPTLHCGAFSISNLRFSDLSAGGENCISVALLVYRTRGRLGGDQLNDDSLVARRSRYECAGGNPGKVESISGQNLTRLTGGRERWTRRSGFSMLAFPNDHHTFSIEDLARRRRN